MKTLRHILLTLPLLALFAATNPLPAAASEAEPRPTRAVPATRETKAPVAVMRSAKPTSANKVFAPPGGGHEWKCTEYDTGAVSCECKGMNDCKKLLDSGKCEGKSWWEDGNDPSVGGCDGSN